MHLPGRPAVMQGEPEGWFVSWCGYLLSELCYFCGYDPAERDCGSFIPAGDERGLVIRGRNE